MKNKTLLFAFLFLIMLPDLAFSRSKPALTAFPLSKALELIQGANFSFKEQGQLFGYTSSESCMFVSEKLMIVQHYCSEPDSIPARAMSIWSPDFGILYLYQEDLGKIVKRDIEILSFPEDLGYYLIPDLRDFTVERMASVMEKMYKSDLAACWSVNYDDYTAKPDSGCLNADIGQFLDWAQETQSLVASEADWQRVYAAIAEKIRSK